MRERERGGERDQTQSNYIVPPTIQEQLSLFTLPRDFHYNHNWLQMFKDTTKRLPNAQAYKQETSNAQSQLKDTSNAQTQKQEISNEFTNKQDLFLH